MSVPPVPQSGIITAADLYREVTGVRTDLAAFAGRLAVVEVRNSAADGLHADHETRLRVLERFRFTLMGGAALAGSLAGWLSSWLLARGH